MAESLQPAARSNPSRLRFTLRTMLVVLTGLCIGLGIYTKRARDQNAAVRAIRASGGEVRYDFQPSQFSREADNGAQVSPYPGWLVHALGEDYLHQVVEASLTNRAAIQHVRNMPRLTGLGLADALTSDDDMEPIRHLRRLEKIIVYDGYGFTSSSGRDGGLGPTKISNRTLALVGQLPAIKWISLHGEHLNAEGLAALAQAETLEHVELATCDIGVTAKDFEPFQRAGKVLYLRVRIDVAKNSQRIERWGN